MDAAGGLLAMLVSYADGIRAEKWTHGYLTFTKPAIGKRQRFKHTMLEQADQPVGESPRAVNELPSTPHTTNKG